MSGRACVRVAVGFGLLWAGAARAAITVNNASFENPALADGAYQGDANNPGTTIPGWGSDGSNGAQNFINTGAYGAGGTLPGTGQGKQAVYINGNDVYQDVGPLLPNTTYTLKVAAGNQPGYGPGSAGHIALVNGTNAGGTVLSSTLVGPNNDPSHPLPISNFVDFTVTYTTGAAVAGDLTIVLAKDSGNQIDYDNVRLDVPEPGCVAAVGLAAVGVLARRRWRGRHGI